MRKVYIVIFFATILFAACGQQGGTTQKKGSSGKTLEMLVVADRSVYAGDTKQLIDSLFKQPQMGLPQPEPMFDVVNIPTSSFYNTEMFRVHRNVLVCDIKEDNPNKAYQYADRWAAPQVVFELAASSRHALDSMIEHLAPRIIKEMHEADYRRIAKAFGGIAGYDLMHKVEQQFGFSLTLSNEFQMANANNPSSDFAWIRKEAKDFGIGVLVSVADYTDTAVFRQEVILDRLDTLMRRHVPGPSDSSYMATERRLDIYTVKTSIGGSPYAVETRGCWRLMGDFMGGPFVCYTLLDPQQRQVITLTGYVYCPRFNKRDYLMQVDGICHSIKFLEEKQ